MKLGALDYSTEMDNAEHEIFLINKFFRHPDFRRSIDYNDIALINVNREIKFNDYIRPICLYQFPDLPANQAVIAAGWGDQSFGKFNYNKKYFIF